MKFFNKKEEVIDLKLTQFGRHMLSKGKLKPAFYSFHDDNVLYDTEKAGFSETQNESEARIVETPTLHHQVSISSLEKDFNNSYEKIWPTDPEKYSWELLDPSTGEVAKVYDDTYKAGSENYYIEDMQRTAEKHYFLSTMLGTSDLNSEYAPAWSVNFLNGTISGSNETLSVVEKTGGNNLQHVPQIESVLRVEVEGIDLGDEDLDLEEVEDGFLNSNISITSADEQLYFLLKITENNGLFQKENFDIEFFEIQEEKQGTTTIETLRQLKFSATADSETGMDFIDEVIPDEDQAHVEYYLDVLVDNEIGDDILCKFDPVNENQGVYADKRTKLCQDVINQQKKKVFDIYTDEADDPGEIC